MIGGNNYSIYIYTTMDFQRNVSDFHHTSSSVVSLSVLLRGEQQWAQDLEKYPG